MYKCAVVPLDGSAVAETILPFILEIAGPLDMNVALLRVVSPVMPLVVEGTPQVIPEAVEGQLMDAEEYLAPLAVELRNKGVRVECHVRRGVPTDEILASAREIGADLIAMTTHGRSGLGRLLFGSVAEEVLRHSDIPVFLMRCTEADVARRAAREAHP
ncbi:MAG TPA: universal stress protein [Candidatus Methylomirabilis sp.]|nr:universal stress protein [Candidatus Methylomirabilis sp.]